MKLKYHSFRSLLLASSALCVVSSVSAGTLYWDGGTADIAGNGNGIGSGNPLGTYTGNWNTTVKNWDAGAGSLYSAWNNSNNDTAVFSNVSGTGTVTIGTGGVTVGGLDFYSASGYTITAGTNGLNFGATNNSIRMVNGSSGGSTSTAAISGTIGGSGNVILSGINPVAASTLTFTGTNTTGWSGTTTINAGTTLAVDGGTGNRALGFTSGITLNGGSITTGSGVTTGNIGVNFFNDSAAITVNGGGSFTWRGVNTGTGSETIGASVTVNSGQMSFQGGSQSSGTNTMIIPSITRTITSSALVFSQGNGSPLVDGNVNKIQVSGSGTTSGWASGASSNPIIGPWATTGTTGAIDYVAYSSNMVVSANTVASAQGTWTTAANAYTMSALASGTISGGTKNITALRSTNNAVTVTANSANIALASHNLAVGDVVTFSAATMPTGLTAGTPYYVISTASGTIQVSATKGGVTPVTPTTAGTTVVAAGGIQVSSGNNLGTTGILNSSATTLNIVQDAGAGVVTLPTSTAGDLHVNTAGGAITIAAPITNNTVSGVLTLVKNGANTLTLQNTGNTYSGGTVINSGTLAIGNVGNIGGAGASLTFGGTGTFAPSAALNFSTGTLNVNTGAVGTISGNGATAFQTTSGSGTLVYSTGGSGNSLSMGNASGFTGTLQVKLNGNANYATNTTVQFASIADTAGSTIQFGGGTSDSNQPTNVVFSGSSNLAFNNRAIEIIPRTGSNWNIRYNRLVNNSASATWTIATDLINRSDRANTNTTFGLAGTNTGNNIFSGAIGDSVLGSFYNGSNVNGIAPLTLEKSDGGTWTISGNNTHSGGTILTAGKLNVNSATALGTGTFTIAGGTFDNTSGSAITLANNNAQAWNGDFLFSGTNNLNLGTGNVTLSANRAVTIGGTLTVGGAIGGGFNLVKGGGGTLVLSGTNSSYSGSTTVNQGVIEITSLADVGGGNSSLGAPTTAPNGTIGIGATTLAATLRYVGTGSTTNRVVNLSGTTGGATLEMSGTGTLLFTSNFTATGAGVKSLTLDGSTAGIGHIQGNIVNSSSATSLIKNGTGTWILSGASTFTGGTTVNAGMLVLSGNNTLSATTGSLTLNGGTLRLEANAGNTSAGVSSALGYATGSATGNASPGINANASGVSFHLRSDSSVTFAGTSGIAGLSGRTINIDVNNNGSGSDNTITLSPNGNVYGGNVTVNITGGNGYKLATGGWNSNNTGGTLTFNPTTASVSLGNFTANTGTPTRTVALDGTSSGNSIGAITSANYSVTKSNTSTWTLNGSSTYTGATNVNGGTLLINGSTSTSVVTVAAAGTLGGTGTVGGATTVNGTYAPGQSPGTMTFQNTLMLAGTSIIEVDGTSGAGVAGGHDFTNLTGAGAAGVLTYGGTMTIDLGVLFAVGSYSWDLFDFASETGGFTAITLADQYGGSLSHSGGGVWGLSSGGDTWSFTEANGVLALTVVPEPRTALLGAIGVLLLLRRRR